MARTLAGLTGPERIAEAAGGKSPSIDPERFRRVMSQFASGVTVITTTVGDEIRGMTASAFLSGSMQPPLCVVSVARRARMHAYLEAARRFAVNILAEDQAEIAIHFAGQPDAHADFSFGRIDGLPVLTEAVARMAAETHAMHPCGDHTLFVGRMFHMEADSGRSPLIYHQSGFRGLSAEGGRDVDDDGYW